MKKSLPIKTAAKLVTGLSICLFGVSSFAQDIHFSQYNQTPSLLNPALTGSSSVIRASVIYRDQWSSVTVPYKTFGASFEMKLPSSNWKKVGRLTNAYKKAFGKLGAGLSFYSDKAGDGNMGTTQANLSLATFVPVTDASILSVGLQASVVQRKIDFSKLVFPDQYSGTGYDPNISNGENVASQNFIYPDFAGGVNYSYGYGDKAIGSNTEFKMNLGVSAYHFNQPKQKFLTASSEKLDAKIILHGDALIGIGNTNLGVVPSFMMEFQKPSKEILLGLMLKYYLKNDTKYTGLVKRSSFGVGGYFRTKDAFIVSGIFEFGQYAIGCSYDINTSKLSSISKVRGGPEIFLRFVSSNPFLYQKK